MIALLAILAGSTTYAVMSDNSIHGLTVKMYNVSRVCIPNSSNTAKIVTFKIGNALVWSTSSLQTSLTHVNFNLTADGFQVGAVAGKDASFGPGQSASYSLTFQNPAIDPGSLPPSSRLALTVTALVSAGLYSSWVTAFDSEIEIFGPTC